MITQPDQLFKYYSFDKGYRFIQTKRLYLSQISEFNDPFECAPKGDISAIYSSQDGIASMLGASVATLAASTMLLSPLVFLGALATAYYKTKSKKDKEAIRQFYIKIINEVRIGCFSETKDNLLMWGHYGRGHSGLVIEFNASPNYWFGRSLLKVTYDKERLDMDKLDIPFDLNHELLRRKSVDWQYEQEWRYIEYKEHCCATKSGQSYEQLSPNIIRAIYLGCKMEDKKKQTILTYCQNYLKTVPIYQMIPDDTNYRLIYKLL